MGYLSELVAPVAILVSAIIVVGATLNQVKQLEKKIETKVDNALCAVTHKSLMRELDSIQRKLDAIAKSVKCNPETVGNQDHQP